MSVRNLLLALLLALPIAAGAATVTAEVTTPDTGQDPNTSGAFTPATNDLLVVGVCASSTADATWTLTSSIGGFTFTQVESTTYGAHSVYVFVSDALVSSATSQTVTATSTADVSTGTNIAVAAVAGVTRVGLDAILQDAEDAENSSGDTPTTVFASSALTGNPTIGFACNGLNPAALTEPTGWTEAADTGYATPDIGIEWVYRNSGFTGTTMTWGSTYGSNGAAISVEIDTSAASSPPSFTSVTVNAAANGYDIDYEITGENGTVYAVACSPGDTAPNQAELEAGQCGGGNAAWFAANEAYTADVAADLALTEANNPPRADVYVTCAGVSGDCTISTNADEDRTARSGFAFQTMASHASTGLCNLDSYFDPDCADGDVFEYEDDTNESADCNVSIEADGDAVLTPVAAGDCDGKRTFNISYQDISSATTGLFTAPTTGNFTTDDLVCVNNSAPEAADPLNEPIVWTEDQAIDALDLTVFLQDPDGDSLTFTLTTGTWPTGVSQSGTGNKDVTGTPTTENEAGVALVITGTDECGDSTTFSFYDDASEDVYVVNTWTAPDCVGGSVLECAALVEADAPWRVNDTGVNVADTAYSDTVPSGDIISQDPAASAEMTAFETLNVTLSLGPADPAVEDQWVSYARVWRFREVRKVYGSTTAFKNAVEDELRTDGVWARWSPGTDPWSGSSNMEIDVTNIPGVVPLRPNGIPYP